MPVGEHGSQMLPSSAAGTWARRPATWAPLPQVRTRCLHAAARTRTGNGSRTRPWVSTRSHFCLFIFEKVSDSLDAQLGVRGNRGPPPSGRCGRFVRLLKWVGLAELDPGRVLVPRSLPGGLPPAPRALTQKPLSHPLSRAEGRHGRTSADRRHRAPHRVSLAAALRKGAGPAGASLLLTGVRGVPRKVLRRPLLKQGTRASFQNSSRK